MVKTKNFRIIFCLVFINLLFAACNKEKLPLLETGAQNPMPNEWIDQDTGHRLKKLVPDGRSNRSFYFHNNPFIPGDKLHNDIMIYYSSVDEQPMQLFSLDMKTGETKQLTNKQRISGEIVGKKSRKVYYQCRDSVFSTAIDNGETRLVYIFPDTIRGSITTLNADETLLAGAISTPQEREIFRNNPEKKSYFDLIFEARLERSLYTLSVEEGELNIIHTENAWLNHIQFSPTDPDLMMYCHEGPWHKLDRIWTIDINERIPRLMHHRSVDREIAGHEFFSPDGKRIWFDLQIPRSVTFYLSSVDIDTGDVLRYGLTRDEWSVHFNSNADQTLFAGDGGDPGQVAKAKDGMWIYLFRPDGDSLRSEKLVNMKHHDYDLEPNVHFSPDGKWIIFRANFEGNSDIYAVEIKPAKK
ncbi:MAG: hypothetical protein JW798_15085 [Prolixibacteraceae bacterium]|nr:hypothetical protein [Prolixibacteraceae bacterium]